MQLFDIQYPAEVELWRILTISNMSVKLCIREEKLWQLLLWKMVHFALFLVKISINFSPSYSTDFFSITVDVSTLQKFQKFSTMF
jgi:hypothetical protein